MATIWLSMRGSSAWLFGVVTSTLAESLLDFHFLGSNLGKILKLFKISTKKNMPGISVSYQSAYTIFHADNGLKISR